MATSIAVSLLCVAGCSSLKSGRQGGRLWGKQAERDIDGIMVRLQPPHGSPDLDDDGYGDGVTMEIWLFSRKTHQPCVVDGRLTITVYRKVERGKPTKVKQVEVSRDDLLKNALGGTWPRYLVGLFWKELRLRGKGVIRVEFTPTGGGQSIYRVKEVDFRPVKPRPGRPLL